MKLFRKTKSKFYWYDFTVRGHRYRGSTQETKADRASKVAGLKLAQVVEGNGQLPKSLARWLNFLNDSSPGSLMPGWNLKRKGTTAMAGGC